jgi:hypothetical protein
VKNSTGMGRDLGLHSNPSRAAPRAKMAGWQEKGDAAHREYGRAFRQTSRPFFAAAQREAGTQD